MVGGSATQGDIGAFIWNRAQGMQDLQDILTTTYMLDLTGWALSQANAVSDDGRTVAGVGTNPNGDAEAWVVHFEP